MKNSLPVCILFLIACSLFFYGCASSPSENAPLTETDDTEIVRLAPDVRPEMLSAGFWLSRSKKTQKVKMTLSEIAAFNRANEKILFPGSDTYYISCDLRKSDSVMTSSEIKQDMAKYSEKNPWYKKITSKKGEKTVPLTKKDWKKFNESMNVAPLSAKKDFPVRKAVCVRRSNIRLLPNEDFYSDDENYWYDDILSNSGILMNEPVLVLWESRDKSYFYVKTSFCAGWVPSSDIAFCSDEEFERRFDYPEKNQKSFVVITEDRYTLHDDYAVSLDKKNFSSSKDLFLGTFLFTADWNNERFSDIFSEREPFSSYLVEIPCKNEDGTLGENYAAIPAGVCSPGLLPYTSENVLNLAFKMLGNRYGWGGMALMRDCSEYLKDIFRCFGFNLPRNSRAQLSMAGKTLDFNKKSLDLKKAALSSLEPGTFLGFPGHVFMYLGTVNGKNYVLSALGSYYKKEKSADSSEEYTLTKINANSVSINTVDELRKTGISWAENLTNAKLLENDGKFADDRIGLNLKWKFSDFSKINSGKAVLYKAASNRKNITVAVNAGHGTRGGDKEKTFSHPDKTPKVTGGTNAKGAVESIAVSVGMTFSDGKKEADVTLRCARFLKNRLLKKGYDVLMIRETSDVQLDNVARTVISNNSADIHIAVHFDQDGQKEDKGCFYCSIPEELKILPTVKNHWKESERLGGCLITSLEKAGLKIFKNGKFETDLTQTSFSTIPTVDIELGNQHTDTSTEGLKSRADALCDGIEKYFTQQ